MYNQIAYKMSATIFKLDGELLGVFNNKKDFKNTSFHYILEYLISKGFYKTKKQCGNAIKEDLKLLYSEETYVFTYNSIRFEKQTLTMNKIGKKIEPPVKMKIKDDVHIPKISTGVSGNYVFYTISDLTKPVKLIDVSRYLT